MDDQERAEWERRIARTRKIAGFAQLGLLVPLGFLVWAVVLLIQKYV